MVLLLPGRKNASSTSSMCTGFKFCRKALRLKEEPGPCPPAALLSLDGSPLGSHLLLSLISSCSLELREGGGG